MGFVGQWKLDDDAVDREVGIGGDYFVVDFGGSTSVIIFNVDSDIVTVFNFKSDVFHDDGIVAVADDEEFGMEAAGV